MTISSYRDLKVYEKGYALSLQVHKHTLGFPRLEQYELASQMRRASKSICANLAEGFGKSKVSKSEFRRYVQVALGSAEEMQAWLEYSFDLGYMSEADFKEMTEGYQEVCRMLQGLHASWK